MTALSTFLTRLSPTWQALTALGGAVALGVAIALVGMRFRGLPAQVRALDSRVTTLEYVIREVQGDTRQAASNSRRILCLIALPDSLSAVEGADRCP